MKVLHILDSLNRGGTEVLELDVCRNARKHGLDLIFVATGAGDLENEFRCSEVEFVRLQRRAPVDLLLVRRLRRLINERGVNVVHAHQAVEALHVYLATLRTSVKQVMSFHLCTGDNKNQMALGFLAPRMHANVAVSGDLLKCLKQAGFQTQERFHQIYNGVDITRLQSTGEDLRAELGLKRTDLLMGMVANFYPDNRKDQLTICRALPKLFAAVPNAQFLFAGSAVDGATAPLDRCIELCREQNISERVHFLGKRTDIPDVLNSLDVYVHSSVNESLGIAVIEAMLQGLPVIVSDIGALLEVTANGDCATVFRTGDAENLAQRLIELAQDPERRASLGTQGREWAVSQFSIDVHIANLLKLYTEIASE